MTGRSELEPNDSRNVTGMAHTPDDRWSGDAPEESHGGELEPNDSRNVTGMATTEDGRWTGAADRPEERSQVQKPRTDRPTGG
jgi:hypothetical protein